MTPPRAQDELLASYIVSWLCSRNGGELNEALTSMKVRDWDLMHDELVLILMHGGRPPNWIE